MATCYITGVSLWAAEKSLSAKEETGDASKRHQRKVEALVALLASQQEQDVKQTQERDRHFEHKEAGLIELIDHKLV